MSDRGRGYLYLASAMVLVGSTVIASKLIAAGLPPFTATALRFAIALPVFIVLMRLTGTAWPRPRRRDALILLVQAGAGSVGYTTLLISGMALTSAADAGVIIGTLPVVSAAIAVIILGERPRPAVVLAVILAAAGVIAIALQPGEAGTSSLLGNVLIFAAVVCEGLFILLNKRLAVPIPALAQSTVMTALGLAIAAVPAIAFETAQTMALAALPVGAIAAVAYYAVVPTVGGFLLWYAGAARTSGAEAALFTALAPVSAVAFAATLLGEPVGLNQMAGIGCVLVAVLSLSLAPRS